MSDGVDIQVEARRLLERFERLPKEEQTAIKRGFTRGLLLAEDRVRTRSDIRSRRGAAGVMGRLTSHVFTTGRMDVEGAVGFRRTSGFPYEIAQEYGAKAKSGGAMAIPVSNEARALSERGISARNFPQELFMVPGTHVLAEDVGKRTQKLNVHYVLVKSIRPRLKFRENVESSIPNIMSEIVHEVRKLRGVS